MPLTIKPVNSLSALHAAEFNFWKEFGHLHLWIGDYTIPDVDSGPSVFTSRGFIYTSPSDIEGEHNCDNLQLNGELIDFRYLDGWVVKPYNVDNRWSYDSVMLKNANTGVLYPCHSITKLGETSVIYGTESTKTASRKAAVVMTTSDCRWTVFEFILNGQTGSVNTDITVSLMYMPNGIRVNDYSCRSRSITVSLAYRKLDEDTLRNFVMPKVWLELTNGWERTTPTYRYDSHVFISHSHLESLSSLSEDYLLTEESWLSALNEYTSKRMDFGELHYRAISKIDTLDVNGIAYLRDMKNILKDIKSLYQTLRGNVNPKGLADLFLSFKYGLPQTYEDTKDVIAAIKATKRSGVSVTQVDSIADLLIERTSTIRYKPIDGTVEDVYNFLRQLDLLVNAENVWELIPFSFVLDWFLDIDGKLERLDQLDHLNHLHIDAVYDSQIVTVSCASARFITGVTGIIDVRRFTRHCSYDASFPLIVSNQPSPISHWLEGTALIIQRLFK